MPSLASSSKWARRHGLVTRGKEKPTTPLRKVPILLRESAQSNRLAEIPGVKLGETVTVEVLEIVRPVVAVALVATVDELVGLVP
jgi:hypothetical protein